MWTLHQLNKTSNIIAYVHKNAIHDSKIELILKQVEKPILNLSNFSMLPVFCIIFFDL